MSAGRIERAVLTAAGPDQRELPLQTLVGPGGERSSVLRRVAGEALAAGVREVAVVIHPDDREAYARAAGELAESLTFVPQAEPRGYAHALACAREFAGDEPFLHLVGDHVWLSRADAGCAEQLVEVAAAEDCTVAAVQATRERRLSAFGAVGGTPVKNRPGLFAVEEVLEKPSPTEAEVRLHVAGLRAGHYLCFFGMHVLSPGIWSCLEPETESAGGTLSGALARLAGRERVLAFEPRGVRYDVGSRYGLLLAQLGQALAGEDREEVLAELVELLATRDPSRP